MLSWTEELIPLFCHYNWLSVVAYDEIMLFYALFCETNVWKYVSPVHPLSSPPPPTYFRAN